jgi:endonuclease YncB( thermonuclease family)
LTRSRRQAYVFSRRSRTILIGVGLLGLASLICLDRAVIAPRWSDRTGSPEHAAAHDRTRYGGRAFEVVSVIDGDTLDVGTPDEGSPTTRVRLLGVDAPEMHDENHQPVYFAREATDFARKLASGTQVTLYLDRDGPTRGKYGRLLAYVTLLDDRVLNEVLVEEGYAYADLRFEHSYYHKYEQLQASARALGIGLWAKATRSDLPAWLQRMRPDLLAD